MSVGVHMVACLSAQTPGLAPLEGPGAETFTLRPPSLPFRNPALLADPGAQFARWFLPLLRPAAEGPDRDLQRTGDPTPALAGRPTSPDLGQIHDARGPPDRPAALRAVLLGASEASDGRG